MAKKSKHWKFPSIFMFLRTTTGLISANASHNKQHKIDAFRPALECWLSQSSMRRATNLIGIRNCHHSKSFLCRTAGFLQRDWIDRCLYMTTRWKWSRLLYSQMKTARVKMPKTNFLLASGNHFLTKNFLRVFLAKFFYVCPIKHFCTSLAEKNRSATAHLVS